MLRSLNLALFSLSLFACQSNSPDASRSKPFADTTADPVICPTTKPDAAESTTKPYPRYAVANTWCPKVNSKHTDPARKDARFLFIGDSITEYWKFAGDKVWKEAFTDLQPLNLGIGGDQTQNLLWRFKMGELDGLNPELIVLLIGTNNLRYGWSEEQAAQGVEAVVRTLRARFPQTPILHLMIFPAGQSPTQVTRSQINKTNTLIRQTQVQGVEQLDIGEIFLNPDGTIKKELMEDFLHPSTKGYQVYADRLLPELERFLAKKPKQ